VEEVWRLWKWIVVQRLNGYILVSATKIRYGWSTNIGGVEVAHHTPTDGYRHNMTLLLLLVVCFAFVTLSNGLLQQQYSRSEQPRVIKFCGGGIFFWWQAGASKYIDEHRLPAITTATAPPVAVVGTSAGSLTATLLVNRASFDGAAEYAIEQAYRNQLFDRRLGLYGIWGGLVREWLDALLPERLEPRAATSLHLAVQPFPALWRGAQLVTGFQSKGELIDACLASTHIPLFMDTRFTARLQGRRYIDGSFWTFVTSKPHPEPLPTPLVARAPTTAGGGGGGGSGQRGASPPRLLADLAAEDMYVVDWHEDAAFRARVTANMVTLITPDGVREMMDAGYAFMKHKHQSGRVPDAVFQI